MSHSRRRFVGFSCIVSTLLATASLADAHLGATFPLAPGWNLSTSGGGATVTPIPADPDYPGVAALEIDGAPGTLHYYQLRVERTFDSKWRIRTRVRVVDPSVAPSSNIVVEYVPRAGVFHRLEFGSGAQGETLIRALGSPTTVTVPPLRAGSTTTEYVTVDLVGSHAAGSLADVFVNGVEVFSDVGSTDLGVPGLYFGDRGLHEPVGAARFAEVSFHRGAPACRDGYDLDDDGLVDFSGGDPDCSQASDPTESGPVVPCLDGVDTDGDGICDVEEVLAGTDANDADTDDDLLPDGFEVRYALDPLVANGPADDADADGFADLAEQAAGTDPSAADTDGDGLADGAEIAAATDPLRPDTDVDGVLDGDEIALGTNALADDTDGDGLRDGFEVDHGFDPLVAGEQSGDPDADALDNLIEQGLGSSPIDGDSDGDGVGDGSESFFGLDPANPDSDADGMPDGFEIAHAFVPTDPDEDGDGRPDGLGDADGDGVSQGVEALRGMHPLLTDADADGVVDGDEIGRGLFGPPALASSTNGLSNTDATAAALVVDVDGDGDADLFFYAMGTTPAVLENMDGLGQFSAPRTIDTAPLSANFRVARATFGDLDGDGDPDLVVRGSPPGGLFWFENRDGAGSFGAPHEVAVGFPDLVRGIVTADLDGDDDLDVVVSAFEPGVGSDTPDRLVWFENLDGAGRFGPQRAIAYSELRAVLPLDLDDDGDLDLVAAHLESSAIQWFENIDGAGTFASASDVATGIPSARSLAVGDFDLDGDLDLAAAGDDVFWIERVGPGLFASPPRLVAPGAMQALEATDVDLDGDDDLIGVSLGAVDVRWFDNADGVGTFASRTPVTEWGSNQPGSHLPMADLDGDGDPDLVFASNLREGASWRVVVRVYPQRETLWDDADSDHDGHCDGASTAPAPACAAGGEDTDGDGRYDDGVETDPTLADTDGDGLCDGGPTASPSSCPLGGEDTNGNGVYDAGVEPSPIVIDTDGDRLPDGEEVAAGLDPANADTDGDGVDDWYETWRGWDPANPDTDGDLLLDGFEHSNWPLSVTEADDPFVDPDGDGLHHLAEQTAGTDPFEADTDEDGLLDGEEVTLGTNPLAPDTDGDQLLDSFEVAYGFDPLVAGDPSADSDSDTLSNLEEQAIGTSPILPDTDGDGLGDAEESGPRNGFEMARSIATDGRLVEAADLDGDGDLDVVTNDTGRLGWHENVDGLGSFGPWQAIGTDFDPVAIRTGDVDDDGHIDVVAIASAPANPAGSTIRLGWFRNAGGGASFTLQPLLDTFVTFEDELWLHLLDLDGDDDLDVVSNVPADAVAPAESCCLFLYENADGLGGFAARSWILNDADVVRDGFTDLDGDGVIDAVYGDSGRVAFGVAGPGVGFASATAVQHVGPRAFFYSPAIPFDASHLADVDADGTPDFVVGDDADFRIHRFQSTAPPSWINEVVEWRLAPGIDDYDYWSKASDSSDFDGDGDSDVVVIDVNGLGWRENLDARGGFGSVRAIEDFSVSEGDWDGGTRTADLDGDGHDDLLIWGHGELAWYRWSGRDPLDPDVDGDGLCDGEGTSAACPNGGEDSNASGVYDPGAETDPRDWDTDDDGVGDGVERIWDSDPLDPGEIPDVDGDGVLDPDDNCVGVPNAPGAGALHQIDVDGDGYGNACDGDFDQSGTVDAADFDRLTLAIGSTEALLDLNGDGLVDGDDLDVLDTLVDAPPGPSSLTCADAMRPVVPGAVPCRGPSAFDVDSDGDGVSDGTEFEAGTDPDSAASFPDADGDSVPDSLDNCLLAANDAWRVDSDLDGYGNRCDGDFDNDGRVGGSDFTIFIGGFNSSGPTDLNGGGLTSGSDFTIWIQLFNQPIGPSGLECAGEVPCNAIPVR